MREIKFRAWDNTRDVMVNVRSIYIYKDGKVKCNGFSDMTRMQYTGLKDKNGKEIYEGDILRVMANTWQEPKDHITVVYWNDDCSCFDVDEEDIIPDCYAMYDDDNKEVIGNIYENPELGENTK